MAVNGPKVISLYCGAGGLDLGFADAGFDVVWANDHDAHAIETYRANLGDHAVCADVLETPPPLDTGASVVIGGPPCQGFSVIGRMDREDPRSQHVSHFLDVVEEVQADAFVMENVKALAVNPRWAHVRRGLEDRAKLLGFQAKTFVLNASHYAVPQARERMFFVGIRGAQPQRPRRTTVASPRTVRQALDRLPRFGAPGNDGVVAARVVPATEPIMRPTPYRGSLLFNGSGRPLDLDSPAKTLPASMGGNATPIIDQDELEHSAPAWVVQYHQRLMDGGKPLKRAPGRLRRLTVQEAAALQSFPQEWEFKGPQVAQLRQIGNAVPPRLAKHVATALLRAMEASSADSAPGLRAAA